MANQAWQISAPGKYSLLNLDSPIPRPGPNQALVRIHAASFNYRDVLVADHSPKYPVPAAPNQVPLSDGAGVVEDVGPGSKWKKGDRVFLHPNTGAMGTKTSMGDMAAFAGAGGVDGALRRYLVWRDDRLIKIPEGLSFEEGASIFGAGVTAYSAFFRSVRRLEPGMVILNVPKAHTLRLWLTSGCRQY